MFKKLLKKWKEKKATALALREKKKAAQDLLQERSQKKVVRFINRKKQTTSYLEKAGLDISTEQLVSRMSKMSIIGMLLISFYALYWYASWGEVALETLAYALAVLWLIGLPLLMCVLWLLFYVWIDVKIFKRRVEIEEILPDFLQLASSNIKAGMTIDRALWYAVRPNFGVLAKEVEIVAKETIGGEDLKVALRKFAEKYDSQLLQRSMSLLIEGIESGGEIGELLVKVATNIEDQKIMVKEMSANVTTYVIFITFASIVAAPFLFALSGVLIEVLHNISGSLAGSGMSESSRIGITFSGSGIELADFKIFAMTSLTITAIFSAMIISMIKKGNVKEGAHNVPIFIAVSLILYFIGSMAAEKVMGAFFSAL